MTTGDSLAAQAEPAAPDRPPIATRARNRTERGRV
jgi:hypothetical protein